MRTFENPGILISKQDSQEQCPGNCNPEPLPDFCGHGLRNALGTTFQHKTNFTPSLSTLEPLESENSVAALQTKDVNLTMPQLKKMRQASKLMKQMARRISLNAVCGDIELTDSAAYNSGFLYDDLEKEDSSNFETLESERKTEVLSRRTPELTWKIDSSTIADRRSRTNQSEVSLTRSRPESPQILLQNTNNSQEVYQLRECAAPESKV